MAQPLGIDVAAAQAALDAAGGMPETVGAPVDPWLADAPPSNTPAPAATPVADEPPVDPSATTPPETETEPVVTSIPDEALTPELLQMKRSLQADYTRKMQEIAPYRKLGEEFGIADAEGFRQAAEVFQRLQDPRNWGQIHSELTDYMQQYGMSPAQASAAATDQLAQMAPAEEYSYDPAEADPGTAPVLNEVHQLRQQLQTLTQGLAAERQQAQMHAAQQQEWNRVAQQLTNEENQIRAALPAHLTAEQKDERVTAIYNMMGPDGDLLGAAQRFESLIGSQLASYIATKSGAQAGQPAPLGGGQTITEPAASGPLSMADGHAAAMAHVAAMDRADAGL
jgi:hypothetical protein